MCTITKNEQFDSYELRFDGKPSESVRDMLKANGYRWHGKRGVWYGYKDITEQFSGAEAVNNSPATAEQTEPAKAERQADKERQKELIEKYAQLYGGDNKKSVDYMRGAVVYVIELDDGTLYAIDKPTIKKDFCFNRDYNGMYCEETERNAEAMAHHARTQESYFINQNMAGLLEQLKRFDVDSITDGDDYYLQRYRYKKPYAHNGQYGTDGIAWIEFVDDYANSDKERAEATEKGFRPLTDNEIKKIIVAYKFVIEQHKKRIGAYLKRYGLNHLNVWTYYSD